jgi:hypothetical protein
VPNSAVLTAMIALGVCGIALLGAGLAAVILGGGTLTAIGGVLGVAELISLGRVVERRQAARVAAISMGLLQAILGVALLATGHAYGIVLIPLAGLVVIPLSLDSAEPYFEVIP